MSEGTASESPFEQWANVDLFGHERIVGKVTEAALSGGAFLRIDIPAPDGTTAFTRYVNPKAVFSISPISKELALQVGPEMHGTLPVTVYDLPARARSADAATDGDKGLEYTGEYTY